MVKVIKTENLAPGNIYEGAPLEHIHGEWIYNGLDCCLTEEIMGVIEPQLDPVTAETYKFSRALQAPILEMNLRGVLIDEPERQALITEYEKEIDQLSGQLNRILFEGLGLVLNWNSPKQLIELFYTHLGIPPITKRNGSGAYVPTVNREALEKLRNHFSAKPIVSHILRLRDIGKRVGTLRTETDRDSRIRTSYNIAGTTTGRLSSSFNDFGSGTNLQNIEQRLRRIFIADPGYKFANIDLKSGDSFGVGIILWNLFGDPAYLDACETGDIHTSVARMTWRDLPWTGDISLDKPIAETTNGYRDLSVRDLSKKLGHGTNYYGKPHTMARHTKLPVAVISDFQQRYFRAFPIQRWHEWTASELISKGYLTSVLGRKRWFFGRRNDDTTLREAIAYSPQSTTADVIDQGLLNIWRADLCQCLLQVHDSILMQYRETEEDKILPEILRLASIPIELKGGRTVIIPAEAKVGWNWSDQTKDNPDGLVKYKGHDERVRSHKATSFLDRRL